MKSWIDLRSSDEVNITCIGPHPFNFHLYQHDSDEKLNSSIYDGYINYRYDRKSRSLIADTIRNDQPVEKEVAVQGKRFFISLMSESRIKRGIFLRMKKRYKVKIKAIIAQWPFTLATSISFSRMVLFRCFRWLYSLCCLSQLSPEGSIAECEASSSTSSTVAVFRS